MAKKISITVNEDTLNKVDKKVEEGTFVGGQNAWLAFIYTQIRREAIDLGRKDDRRRKREENVIQDERSLGRDIEMPLFEEGENQNETRRILVESMKTLPKKFSEVISMKLWGERTWKLRPQRWQARCWLWVRSRQDGSAAVGWG